VERMLYSHLMLRRGNPAPTLLNLNRESDTKSIKIIHLVNPVSPRFTLHLPTLIPIFIRSEIIAESTGEERSTKYRRIDDLEKI
jgi:hypothetical protein